MKYTKNDLYEGMKVKCVYTTDTYGWKVGKEYNVGKRTDGTFILKDETGYVWNEWLILDFLNGKGHCKMEIVEEEKEMTKYVEVTKLINWSSDPELLEVGKVYKVVEEYKDILYVKGVSIYVNEEHQSYYLRSDQFKFIDQKEEEKVGTLEAIEAKIEQLENEQKNLYNKRKRIEKQEEALYDKRMKLKEAKKAFEFLKKQNYL